MSKIVMCRFLKKWVWDEKNDTELRAGDHQIAHGLVSIVVCFFKDSASRVRKLGVDQQLK